MSRLYRRRHAQGIHRNHRHRAVGDRAGRVRAGRDRGGRARCARRHRRGDGVRRQLVDTADSYHATANESVIGEALGGLRERPLISSKRWPTGDGFSPAGIHAGCRDSLRRLGADHLDLYFLHWPDERIPLQESWGAMAELADQGLVRAIGLSNYTLAQIEACHAARPVDVIQDGLSLVDYPENRHKVAACGWQGIAAVIYEPLAGGLLAGGFSGPAGVPPEGGGGVGED